MPAPDAAAGGRAGDDRARLRRAASCPRTSRSRSPGSRPASCIAMSVGVALGILMGRVAARRRAGPALAGVLPQPAGAGHHRAGLYLDRAGRERAPILAVALNKIPNVVVTHPRGRARARPRPARDGRRCSGSRRGGRLRDVVLPQLYPYLAGAARSGLALIWKIVLVVELLGRSNGVGFQLGVYFQLFDVAGILAYALSLHRRRPADRMGRAAAARAPCQPMAALSARAVREQVRFPAVGRGAGQARARATSARRASRASAGDHRPVGLRQDHAAQHRRRAGAPISTGEVDARRRRRGSAYVFQEPRLLPWRTVEDNLRLVLPETPRPDARDRRCAGRGRSSPTPRARSFASRLSLGMARRAALARAFVVEPTCCCSTSRSSRSTSPPPSACACCCSSCRRTARPPCSSPTRCARRSCSPTGSLPVRLARAGAQSWTCRSRRPSASTRPRSSAPATISSTATSPGSA